MNCFLYCRIALFPAFCFVAATANAQPAPAAAQQVFTRIIHATLHVGNGQVIDNAILDFEAGRILYAGPEAGSSSAPAGAKILDIQGRHLYPGLIAMNSDLGLTEVEAVRATLDQRESGGLNPHVRSLIAYNTDSKIIPTTRSNGILLAQVAPEGGRISGSSSVVQLDAWNWEDALVKADIGIHLNWPLRQTRTGWWADPGPTSKNDKYEVEFAEIEQLFAEAGAYARKKQPATLNLRLESMRGLFEGSRKLFIRANGAREIQDAVLFCEKHKIRPVITGAEEAHLIIPFLQRHGVELILSRIHRLPLQDEEAVDQPFSLPARLAQAGIRYALSGSEASQLRNIPFVAGTSAGFGISPERALQSITLDAARILGIDDQFGSLEAGKSATFFISAGDALDMRSNQVEKAFIQGRDIDLDDKHKELYRRFQGKYGK